MDLESQAGTPSLTATLEAFNWNTEVFDVVDAGGGVRGRVGWRQTGFTINFPWEIRVDTFHWIAE